MYTLRWGALIGLLAALGLLTQGTAQISQEKEPARVELKVVKYDALAELIQKNQGKVLIVDFWADTCPPCKAAMPHLVKLYNKHKKDGFNAITVAVDLAWKKYDAKVQDNLLKFLQRKGATFTNVVLDVPQKVLEDRLRVTAVPSVYVFNRAGKWTQFADGITAAKLDALVEKLLAEK